MTTQRRSRAREIALQALYQLDLNPEVAPDDLKRFVSGRLHGGPLVPFALGLVHGVQKRRDELDAHIDARAEHWRVARMAATDRGILRLAAHEILHTDTPPAAAADEAIELAKRYGGEGSGNFVAGILGRIIADRAGASSAAVDPPHHRRPGRRSMGIFNFGRKDPKDQPSKDTPAASTPTGSADSAEKPRGLLDRLKAGLAKTAQVLRTDVRDLFKREGRLVDEDFLEELRGILVRTDMGPAAAEAIVDDVRERLRARVVDPEVVLDSIRTQLLARLRNTEAGLTMAVSGPTVILVTGVNGSGKTTSIAKLARMFTRDGKRVVLGAGDTFRAAAVEQLTMWADRLGAEIVRGPQGSDPASVAHKAVARAVEAGADVCIVDTAGRLQTQSNLMQELSKIRRVVAKLVPEAPHEVLLVIDATAGQNALSQAKGFKEAAGCTGIVLSKLDGSARGGVIVPVTEQFGLPVKFVGLGEGADDLEPFSPERFVAALLEGAFGAEA